MLIGYASEGAGAWDVLIGYHWSCHAHSKQSEKGFVQAEKQGLHHLWNEMMERPYSRLCIDGHIPLRLRVLERFCNGWGVRGLGAGVPRGDAYSNMIFYEAKFWVKIGARGWVGVSLWTPPPLLYDRSLIPVLYRAVKW